MFKLSPKHIFAYMLIGLGFSVVMGFVYMQYVYYDAMIETLQVTNSQLGLLITILGATAFFTAVPMGALVDRVDCRKALSASLFVMMIFCGVFAFMPTYPVAIATWVIDGTVMSIWYAAIYKCVRVIAPPGGVGKSFGMFAIGCGIGSIVVNVAGLSLYDYFAANVSLQAGLSAILWAFFACGMLSAIVGHICIMSMPIQGDDEEEAEAPAEKKGLKGILNAFKSPALWLYFFADFCLYSFQVSISYFTPYFTAVLGATVTLSGIVAIFRQYGLRIISGPIGGYLGDKLGGTTKVLRVSLAILAGFVVIVLFLPPETPMSVLIALVFAIGLFGTMNVSLQASVSEDAMVPPESMGLAVGLTAMLTPDLFQPALFGSWLDSFGNQGYTYIWIYTIAIAVLGVIVLSIIISRKKKFLAEQEAAEKAAAIEV